MKKGCLFAITIVAGAVFVCGTLGYFYYWPRLQNYNASLLAASVEEGLAAYGKDYGELPEGDNAAVIEALMGENPRQKPYINPRFGELTDDHGRLLDPWNQPFRIQRQGDGSVALLSSGRNRKFDDDDDITSAQAIKVMNEKAP